MPHFKTKDGRSIYYETQSFESSKPGVVFLNGTMQNTVYWKTHSMALKDRFRVLMYDARAQKSDLGEGELSLEGHTEDFSALLKYLIIEKVCLVGLSHGAKVALPMPLVHLNVLIGLCCAVSMQSRHVAPS